MGRKRPLMIDRFRPKADIEREPWHASRSSERPPPRARGSYSVRSRTGQPVMTIAFASGVKFDVVADLIAQPRDELLNDRALGGAWRDDDEVGSAAEHRFTAKRRDQETVAEMARAVRVASDRDAAAINRSLHHLVVMRESQRTCRPQIP